VLQDGTASLTYAGGGGQQGIRRAATTQPLPGARALSPSWHELGYCWSATARHDATHLTPSSPRATGQYTQEGQPRPVGRGPDPEGTYGRSRRGALRWPLQGYPLAARQRGARSGAKIRPGRPPQIRPTIDELPWTAPGLRRRLRRVRLDDLLALLSECFAQFPHGTYVLSGSQLKI